MNKPTNNTTNKIFRDEKDKRDIALPETTEITAVGIRIAKQLGINVPDAAEVLKMLSTQHSLPQLYQNESCQLWIDKHYIAYSRLSETAVHYVYLSLPHIVEEFRSYTVASVSRMKPVCMPKGIERQFVRALIKMVRYKKDYIFFEPVTVKFIKG